jgi:hypothetical protein
MPQFIAGAELCRSFFAEAVRPIVDDTFPQLRYAAALLGTGSEVLGFDTEMSVDHDWGPRVDIYLHDADAERVRPALDAALRDRLPATFRGYPTSFSDPNPNDNGTRLPELREGAPIRHKIGIETVAGFFREYLAFDIDREVAPADWLTFPEQKLRTITCGPIFHDEIGLERTRDRFAYYPRDVWLYLLAAAWTRIGQEEHLMGRAGSVGDEIGSALIGARLVRDVMRLCFLMEKAYAPYPKWLGTAFQRLDCADALSPDLAGALSARTWRDRETHLAAAYEIVAGLHGRLGITDPLPTSVRPFFGRPFQVIALHGFAEAIIARIDDVGVRALAARPRIGGIDQLSDSTDLVSNPEWRETIRRLYETDR